MQTSAKKHKINKKVVVGFWLIVGLIVAGGLSLSMAKLPMPVLQPRGVIAEKERDLMLLAGLLSVLIVVPVFIMLFAIAWKYRASNKKAVYAPDWDHSRLYESIWWAIPCIFILILGIIAWQSSHQLDPYKTLASTTKPVKIQVVALQWKWLFLYPDEHVASVNFMQIPVNTPVDFQITSDAPMNSFWIPSLSGQVYAMSGMNTQLHLMADTLGDYRGSSANISGKGFSGMTFTARVSSQKDYTAWLQNTVAHSATLDVARYNALAQPSQNNPPTFYTLSQTDLYDTIMMKYMAPASNSKTPANKTPVPTPKPYGE